MRKLKVIEHISLDGVTQTTARSWDCCRTAPIRGNSYRYRPGDLLVAFTDGISEAMNPAQDEWGEDQLLAEAQANAQLHPAKLLDHLFRAADTLAGGAPQHDDMTLLLLQRSA